MELDDSEFNKASEQVIAESEKTYPDWINGRMLAVSSKALKNTDKADADHIAIELGQMATQVSHDRATGRIKKGRRVYFGGNTFAARIVNARRKRQGLPLIWGDELNDAAKREIGRRLKAVAFIKSGWIYAIKTLSRVVGYSSGIVRNESARMTGTEKGYATPAQRVFNSECTGSITNTALLTDAVRAQYKSGHHSNPMPIAVKGLQMALDQERVEMLKHLEEKLNPVFAKHSAA